MGLTPQSVNVFGGYKVQGKTPMPPPNLIADAKVLEQAGAASIIIRMCTQ
jgi:3-methyl-2-oxobutanoate hydroxymethyltransferase